VFYDEFTGRARGLGAITWRIWKESAARDAAGGVAFEPVGVGGTIVGPDHIAARVVYGGEKLGLLHTRPHLYGLALLNVEETQVASDYAKVMHLCNVPTPIFVGRNVSGEGAKKTVQMGQGIDIPIGGSASFLEPSGAALGATRTRLLDIQLQMRRQGASTAQGEGGPARTATAEAQDAKARNAKIRRAARSLQDALEGVLADMAAFMGIATKGSVKSGGSVAVTQNFAGVTIDPQYLAVLVQLYKGPDRGLTLEEIRYVVQNGEFSETFDPDDVLELVAEEAARQDQAALDAKAQLDANAGKGAEAAA
jgi:hypothetical protein